MLTPQAWLTEGAEYQGGEDGIGTEIRLISLFICYTIKLPDNSSNNPLLTTCHFWVLCECLFYRHACFLAVCNSPACFESLFCSQLNQALQVCLWGILTRPPAPRAMAARHYEIPRETSSITWPFPGHPQGPQSHHLSLSNPNPCLLGAVTARRVGWGRENPGFGEICWDTAWGFPEQPILHAQDFQEQLAIFVTNKEGSGAGQDAALTEVEGEHLSCKFTVPPFSQVSHTSFPGAEDRGAIWGGGGGWKRPIKNHEKVLT